MEMINPQIKEVNYDTISIWNLSKVRYTNPVLTKSCIHRNACFEMQEALQVIQNNQIYQCPYCQYQAKNLNDLVQDWRVKAYEQFSEYVDEVTIIKGIMVNKYIRNKVRYVNFFTSEVYTNQFLLMCERVSNDTSINSLIKKDLKMTPNQQQDKIIFWSFCLQDRVKINIPVRILRCKHYECYELTSLLFYQEQNRKKKLFFECNQPGCSNKLQIAHKEYSKQDQTPITPEIDQQEKIRDIEKLFSEICVDKDLLAAIKLSNPSSYKFFYNKKTEKIQEDINTVDGKLVDPFIQKFYEHHQDLQNKMKFEDFQNQIQQQAMSVSQGDLLQEDKQLGKQIALYKYRNYTVKMLDPLTQLTIEYPVRCKFCTDLQVCMDMRSYILDFSYQKKMYPTKIYSCPLCKKQQSGQMFKTQIQNYIYLDSNMLSYMFKDMSYTDGTNIFQYKGEQYMLQEFMDKQKIKREAYIASLNDRQVVFKQLNCVSNQNQRIKQPLILQNCDHKYIVDFKSFYEELKKIDFDYENKGLQLCKCNYCNSNPIKTFAGNIYFHEAFYEALNKFYKNGNRAEEQFTYKFCDKEGDSMVIEQLKSTNNPKIKVVQNNNGIGDVSNLKNLKGEEGFLDLMDDEEYQKFFGKTEIQGYKYKAQGMQQTIGGVQFDFQQDGIHANIKETVDKFNETANPELKRFQFNVVGMSVQLNNGVIKQSQGEFQYTKK